jgi:hypothetical protein
MLEARENAVVAGIVVSPETAHDVNSFFAHFHARGRIEPEDLEFVFLRRFAAPAEAHAKIDAPAGHPIETGKLVGEKNGMAQRRQENCRSETQPARARADRGERRQRIDARAGGETVAYPD